MFHVVVGGFYFCDLIDVLETNSAVPNVAWLAGALFNAGRLFQKVRCWWCLCDEAKGAIGANENGGRDWCSRGNVRCAGVELFTKVH